MRRALSLLLLATAVVGCQSKTPEPAKVPLGQAPAAAAATSDDLTGPVLEQLNAPPYIYLRIKTSKGEVWAAVPGAKIENGAVVTVFNPMLMSKFESKSLKRTFDEVYFGTLAPASAEAAGLAGKSPAGAPQPVAQVVVGKVEKATGADARTVSELWAQKASLVGKTVSIRGTVVKYNEGVMGKNWIHLQDGSGDAKQGTNDITVTSLDGASRGETITIKGTVRTNRDFGAGYSYAIIVEDAKVIRK
jgi:hypothetical protein